MRKGAKFKSKHLLNKYYSIVILMVFVLIINGCAAKPKTYSPCEQKTTQGEKDGCYNDAALMGLEPDYCTQIVDKVTRNNCYWNVASHTGEVSLCDKIDDDYTKNFCRGVTLNKQR